MRMSDWSSDVCSSDLEHDLAIDHALLDIGARRQVVHDVEEHLLEDGPQTTGPGASQQGLVGNRLESVVAELQLDVLQLEELLVLLHQRVLGLAEDAEIGKGSCRERGGTYV